MLHATPRLLKKCYRNLLQGIQDAKFTAVAFPKNHGRFDRSCKGFIYAILVSTRIFRDLKSFLCTTVLSVPRQMCNVN